MNITKAHHIRIKSVEILLIDISVVNGNASMLSSRLRVLRINSNMEHCRKEESTSAINGTKMLAYGYKERRQLETIAPKKTKKCGTVELSYLQVWIVNTLILNRSKNAGRIWPRV